MESLETNIIKRFIEGDEKAFELVFNLFSRNIWLYFYQNTHSREITEELVQDTFIRLWNYRNNIDQEQGVKKYLNQIARSIFYNWLQELAKEKKKEVAYADYCNKDDSEVKCEDVYSRMDINSLIEKTHSILSEKRRKVFLMSRVHGLSYDEIATQLSIGKETVKDHISKATRKLSVLNQSGEYL
ncbi:RNA polymerase sigma factor [Arcticibacter eurypsychrophilus]|uniref:RNA polymerase sigma factor n=1 Tax=Arcticibacter eurypsychrophilus TaxID=1434752 RepID=UPI00084DBC95|nr:sigma-70 family RNA polymerase sigma factor [Arcticibacter eurypsychrophilus]